MSKIATDAYRVRNMMRQLCRTDIFALCRLLGYMDVSPEVHQPIVDILTKLPGGVDSEVSPGVFEYKPYKQIWQLDDKRETLILYPRGHLKTTLVSQAHLIQWIINFPDIRILLSCATGDQVEKVVRAVKGVFQYNDDFRNLFPEFCPENADDFGSSQQFIVPARKVTKGEPTLFCVTVGKTIAGYHPDVIFHSDLVDKENVKTPGGIKDVHDHFKYMNPLLERYNAHSVCSKCKEIFNADGKGIAPSTCEKCGSKTNQFPATRGFTFVEGTPYDFGDLHNTLWEAPEYADWKRVKRPAQEDYPKGKILWPARFTPEELEKTRREIGDWMFSSQYLMKCVPQGDGLCDPKVVVFVPKDVIGGLIPKMRLHVTIDLAGMDEQTKGDFTVVTLGGFDTDGRLYILEIHCGHYSPEQTIGIIFDIHNRWPNIIDFKIEKDAHARVLMPFLNRENSKRGNLTGKWLPPFIELKRDTRISKQHRIRSLRPWLTAMPPIIRFNEAIGLSTKIELLEEIKKFPSQSSGVHDDILDTLADMMQSGDNEMPVTYDVMAEAPDMKFAYFGKTAPRDRFLGFDEEGVAQWLYGPDPSPGNRKISKTGYLE